MSTKRSRRQIESKCSSALGAVLVSCALLLLVGCGGGSSSSSNVTTSTAPAITSVTVSCPANTVPVGQTNQCSATVQGTGSFNPAVNWSVSNVQGGNTTVGTVASSGLYTAPAAVPTPYTVTITATSAGDATKSASASVIVAGTIASVSQTITAAAGGTITLPDGSSVTIAAGVLPSDQTVTLSEVSYLQNQPPNPAVTSVGPGLMLIFTTPVQFAGAGRVNPKRMKVPHRTSQPNSSISTAFHFVINTTSNAVAGLAGSVPVADFVDSLNNNVFIGAAGQYASDLGTLTADIGSDIVGAAATTIKFITVSAVNVVKIAFHLFTAPSQKTLSSGNWMDYSTCPSGKTLLVVHGMLSYVESAFSTQDQTIQNIEAKGGYNAVVGFDYDWTQAIDASGAQLANFLSTLSTQCTAISELDIEAHSEGVPVTMSALTKSSAKVKHLISLGGPIMGTPIANDARLLSAVILGASELDLGGNVVLDTLADLLGKPFVQDLQVSSADSGDKLDSIRKALSAASVGNAPQIITVAGNSPPESYLQWTAAVMYTTYGVANSDGFIPVASALPFQSDLNGLPMGLKIYPLFPYPTGHVDLTSDSSIQQDIGNEVSNAFLPSSLAVSSVSGACWDNLVCNGPPGTQFTIDGSSYSTTANVQRYEEFADGTVLPLTLLSAKGGAITWNDSPDCSAVPRTLVYFTQDDTTSLYSNAVTDQVIAGSCSSAPPVLTSVSPTSIIVGPFTLTLTGTGFLSGAQVDFGTTPLTTTFLSSTQLTATGTATAAQVGTVPVTVVNPGPSTSNAINVTVVSVSGGSSGSTGIIVGTVNGQTVDEAYVPLPNSGLVSVVNVDAANGTNPVVTTIPMPSSYSPNASAADQGTLQIVVISYNSPDVQIIDASKNQLLATLTSPVTNSATFSGGICMICGVTIDPTTNTAILDTAQGYLLLNLAQQSFSSFLSGTVAGENFGYDPNSLIVLNPTYGQSIGVGLQAINLANDSVFLYSSSIGNFPESGAVDINTNIAVVPDEYTGDQYLINMAQAAFDSSSSPPAFSAPTTVFTVNYTDCGGEQFDWSLVSTESSSHLLFMGTEFADCAAVEPLPTSVVLGAPPAPVVFQWGHMPLSPDGVIWDNGGDPHGIAAFTSVVNGKPYGFLVRTDQAWVARVDLTGVATAPQIVGGIQGEVDLTPFVTFFQTQ